MANRFGLKNGVGAVSGRAVCTFASEGRREYVAASHVMMAGRATADSNGKQLKVGMRVKLIAAPGREWNGATGVVAQIAPDDVAVKCDDPKWNVTPRGFNTRPWLVTAI